MLQAVRIHLRPVRSKCDALVMLSCAGGIKTAFLCNPGIPVVAALDSIGSGMVTRQNNPVALSQCVTCGHCVLTFTGGICPISECPSKKKYGPCKKAEEQEDQCVVSKNRLCIWKEISKRGDLAQLNELGKLHKKRSLTRIPATESKTTPMPIRKFSGWFMARIPGISRLIDMVN